MSFSKDELSDLAAEAIRIAKKIYAEQNHSDFAEVHFFLNIYSKANQLAINRKNFSKAGSVAPEIFVCAIKTVFELGAYKFWASIDPDGQQIIHSYVDWTDAVLQKDFEIPRAGSVIDKLDNILNGSQKSEGLNGITE